MRRLALAVLIGAAGSVALLSPPAATLAQTTLSVQRDWTKSVVQTPEGGFRMGNPDAPVKLVEYGSLVCPTCAHFAHQSRAPLMAEIRSGRVNFEFRNYVLNRTDLVATLISRCVGPVPYFALTDAYFAEQPNIFDRLAAVPKIRIDALEALPHAQQRMHVAALAGIDKVATSTGMSRAKVQHCLGDEKTVDRLVAMKQSAWDTYRIRSTPSFLINGKVAPGVRSWTALAPLLKPGG